MTHRHSIRNEAQVPGLESRVPPGYFGKDFEARFEIRQFLNPGTVAPETAEEKRKERKRVKQAKVKAEEAQMEAAVAAAEKVSTSSTQRTKALTSHDVDEVARLGDLLKTSPLRFCGRRVGSGAVLFLGDRVLESSIVNCLGSGKLSRPAAAVVTRGQSVLVTHDVVVRDRGSWPVFGEFYEMFFNTGESSYVRRPWGGCGAAHFLRLRATRREGQACPWYQSRRSKHKGTSSSPQSFEHTWPSRRTGTVWQAIPFLFRALFVISCISSCALAGPVLRDGRTSLKDARNVSPGGWASVTMISFAAFSIAGPFLALVVGSGRGIIAGSNASAQASGGEFNSQFDPAADFGLQEAANAGNGGPSGLAGVEGNNRAFDEPDSTHCSFAEAETAMHEFASRNVCVLVAANAKSSLSAEWRNGQPKNWGRPPWVLGDKQFIEPTLSRIWQRNFSCAFHRRWKRADAVPAGEAAQKQRNRRDDDKNCGFGASITCTRVESSDVKKPEYEYVLHYKAHKCGKDEAALHTNGHGPACYLNTCEKPDGLSFLLQNRKLSEEDKKVISEGMGFKATPKNTLRAMGGARAPDGRIRTTKAVNNFKQRVHQKKRAEDPEGASEVDLMLMKIAELGGSFHFFAKPRAGDEAISDVPDLTHADLLEDTAESTARIAACAGRDLDSVHWLTPGQELLGALYGDVVGEDSTHNTNRGRCPLFLSILTDCEGNGHIGSAHLLTSENNLSIRRAIKFQRDVAGFSLRTIIVDKCNTEISALRMVSPDSFINLCRFHVVKYFRQSISITYLPEEKRETACGLWRKMVYADSEEIFWAAYSALETLAADVAPLSQPIAESSSTVLGRKSTRPTTLMAYLEKNWIGIREHWSLFGQKWFLSRGRLTNGQNERKNGVLKEDGLGLQTTLPELVTKIHEQTEADLMKLLTKTGQSLLKEERFSGTDGPRLVSSAGLPGWIGSAAMEHFSRAHSHAASRWYFISPATVSSTFVPGESLAPDGEELRVGLKGTSKTSELREVTITAARGTFPLIGNDLTKLTGSIDARRVTRVRCSCAEYHAYGGSLCRHGLWCLLNFSSCRLIPTGHLPLIVALFPPADSLRTGHETARSIMAMRDNSAKAVANSKATSIGAPPVLPARASTDARAAKNMKAVRPLISQLADLIHPRIAFDFGQAEGDRAARACRWMTEYLALIALRLVQRRVVLSNSEVIEICRQCTGVCWDVLPDVDFSAGADAGICVLTPHLKAFARSLADVADRRGRTKSAQEDGQEASAWALMLTDLLCGMLEDGTYPQEQEEAFLITLSFQAKGYAATKVKPAGIGIAGRSVTRDKRAISKKNDPRLRLQRELAATKAAMPEQEFAAILGALDSNPAPCSTSLPNAPGSTDG